MTDFTERLLGLEDSQRELVLGRKGGVALAWHGLGSLGTPLVNGLPLGKPDPLG